MGKTAEVPPLRDMISTRYEHSPRKAAGAAGRPAIVKSAFIATKVFSGLERARVMTVNSPQKRSALAAVGANRVRALTHIMYGHPARATKPIGIPKGKPSVIREGRPRPSHGAQAMHLQHVVPETHECPLALHFVPPTQEELAALLSILETGSVTWQQQPPSATVAEIVAAYEKNAQAVTGHLSRMDEAAWQTAIART